MLYLMLVKVFSTLKNNWWFFLLLGWGIATYHSIFKLIVLLAGVPLPFVVIGLGALHDEYGVKDNSGDFQ